MDRREFSRLSFLGCTLAATTFPTSSYAQQKQEGEGGIGGTGIVGLLTDFGSLIVAGARVETGDDTQYADAFGALDKSRLQIGDSLTVEADTVSGRLFARRVYVNYPLVGRVTSVSTDGRQLIVNGTLVRLERTQSSVRMGARVAVLGLWRGNEVVASRIVQARSALDVMTGTVNQRGFRTRVGSILTKGQGRTQDGGFAEVIGRFNVQDGVMEAVTTTTNRFGGMTAPLTQLAVEGYLEPIGGNPAFRVSGLGHSFARNLRLSPFADERVLFKGPYDGSFIAKSGTILPEDFATRRRFLRNLADQT